MATNTKPLKQQSTDELEAAILAINAFIVALIILWLVVTGEPHVRSGQAPKAAEPETSLLVAPSIESTDHETSPPAAPSIAAPQEAPAKPTEAAKPEPSPPAAPPIEIAEPEALPPAAPTVATPAEAPLPSPDPAASPQEPLATPTPPPNAASTDAQPTTPASDVTAPPRQRTSSRPRRSPSAAREATDTWKKGINIFGQ